MQQRDKVSTVFAPGKLARRLRDRVEELGWTPKELAIRIDEVTYETVRRVIRGDAIPSPPVLRLFCTHLQLEYDEMLRLARADKIRQKYGSVADELAGKDPTLAPVEAAWQYLTPEHRLALVAIARDWAAHDRQVSIGEKRLKSLRAGS